MEIMKVLERVDLPIVEVEDAQGGKHLACMLISIHGDAENGRQRYVDDLQAGDRVLVARIPHFMVSPTHKLDIAEDHISHVVLGALASEFWIREGKVSKDLIKHD